MLGGGNKCAIIIAWITVVYQRRACKKPNNVLPLQRVYVEHLILHP